MPEIIVHNEEYTKKNNFANVIKNLDNNSVKNLVNKMSLDEMAYNFDVIANRLDSNYTKGCIDKIVKGGNKNSWTRLVMRADRINNLDLVNYIVKGIVKKGERNSMFRIVQPGVLSKLDIESVNLVVDKIIEKCGDAWYTSSVHSILLSFNTKKFVKNVQVKKLKSFVKKISENGDAYSNFKIAEILKNDYFLSKLDDETIKYFVIGALDGNNEECIKVIASNNKIISILPNVIKKRIDRLI